MAVFKPSQCRHDDGLWKDSRRKTESEGSTAFGDARERMQRQECALHPNVTGSRSTSEEGSRNLELLVAVEGKQKENDGEKGDGSTTTRHDDERRPFLFGTDKRLPKRWTRSFRHHRLAYLYVIVQSSDSMSEPLFLQMIVMVIRGRADGRRFMLTTSKKSSIAFRTVMYSNRGSRRHSNN
jgi:hypothetical protein